MTKTILRALAGETLPVPPVWMMRQAGRYLPEYRATRAEAGDFLSLCYAPDLAAEVTLQPIRRYGFDAAILFADILLLPQALGADLWFETGEGPRLSTITTPGELAKLKPVEAIHDTLSPIYETVRILSRDLPKDTTLIGFAGATPLEPRKGFVFAGEVIGTVEPTCGGWLEMRVWRDGEQIALSEGEVHFALPEPEAQRLRLP